MVGKQKNIEPAVNNFPLKNNNKIKMLGQMDSIWILSNI